MQVPLHVAEDAAPPLARPGAAAGGTRSPTPARARRRRSDRADLDYFEVASRPGRPEPPATGRPGGPTSGPEIKTQ